MKTTMLALGFCSIFFAKSVSAQPTQAPTPANKDGLTFELNIGAGQMTITNDRTNNSASETALAGLSLGVGKFFTDNVAVTGRIAGGTYSESAGRLTQWYLGPAIQYWVSPDIWIGGGIGFGGAQVSLNNSTSDSDTGFGIDLRAGYTFNSASVHSFNVSLEYTRSEINNGAIGVIGVLAGWQVL